MVNYRHWHAVFFYVTGDSQVDSDPDSLLAPARDGRLIEYFEVQPNNNITILRLHYNPLPSAPCAGIQYYVREYTYEDIMNAESKEDVQPIFQTTGMEFPWTEDVNYIRAFAIGADNSSCATTDYFIRLLSFGAFTCMHTKL